MKKGQILAALALAFALGVGVVAPVADTHAVVIDSDAQAASDATTALNKAITDASVAGGYVGNTTKYSLYSDLQNAVANVTTYIKNARDGQIVGLNSALTSQGYPASTKTTYEGVKADVQAVITENYQIAFGGSQYSDARKAQAQTIVTNLQGAVAAAESAINTVVDAKATILANYIDNIDVDYTRGDKTYDQVVADAKALPKYAEYETLFAAVKDGNKVLGADPSTVTQANLATAAINNAIAAINGTGAVTPGDPSEPGTEEPGTDKPTTPDDGKGEDNTDKVGTPNDGALAKAEGSTSASASIMAAIATALTAAGAAFIAIRRKIAAKKEA